MATRNVGNTATFAGVNASVRETTTIIVERPGCAPEEITLDDMLFTWASFNDQVVNLAPDGKLTVTTPTGAKRVYVIPPYSPGHTVTMYRDSDDVGFTIDAAQYACIGFGTAPASLMFGASKYMQGVRLVYV